MMDHKFISLMLATPTKIIKFKWLIFQKLARVFKWTQVVCFILPGNLYTDKFRAHRAYTFRVIKSYFYISYQYEIHQQKTPLPWLGLQPITPSNIGIEYGYHIHFGNPAIQMCLTVQTGNEIPFPGKRYFIEMRFPRGGLDQIPPYGSATTWR